MAPLEGKKLDMSLDEMIKTTGKGSKGSRKLGNFNAGKMAKEGQKKKTAAKGDAAAEEKNAEKKLDMGLDEIIEKDDGFKKKAKGKGGGKENSGKKGGKDADDDVDWNGGKGKKGGKKGRKGGKGDEWDEWAPKGSSKGWGSGGGGWKKETDWQSQEWKGSGKSEWGKSSWGGGGKGSSWDGGGKGSPWGGGGKSNSWEQEDRSWEYDMDMYYGGKGSDRGADRWGHDLYDERDSHGGYDREERSHRGYEREERRPDPRERERRMDDRRGREPSPRRAEPAYGQKRTREEPRASTAAKSRSIATVRVEVSNIPKDLDRRDIQDAFEAETGPILSCDMSAGRAMIVYKHLADARKAVDTFDLGELNNQTIHVKILG